MMSVSIQYMILILILFALELIQIKCSKFKIIKWILPVLSFIFSLCITTFLISFELGATLNTVENGIKNISTGTLMMFPILNIPTIIYISTNLIIKKLNNSKEK